MTARPNYRYADVQCCSTCGCCSLTNDGLIVCAHDINPAEMGYNDLIEWQYQQDPIDPDYICDNYKGEVVEFGKQEGGER